MQAQSALPAPPTQRVIYINFLGTARKILVTLSILVLIATNIATLMSDTFHGLAFDTLSRMLYSIFTDKASDLLRGSPIVVRKTDFVRLTTVIEAKESQLSRQVSHLEQDRNKLKGENNALSENNRKLKADYDDLNFKHKKLTTDNDALRTKNVELAKYNDTLKTNNSELVQVQARRDAAAKKLSSSVAPRVIHTATRAASSLPAKVAPLAGAAVAVGMTLWDIKDMCDTLHDINEMNLAFGHPAADTRRVCGIKVPSF
ncbi:hypothetical protein [Zoogloea sp.]|uniref:hypothetical protein n=1 Tax=Zoogloea sp. TaxID=49181 RepID=UPI002629A31B|nr:hypothetical protein [Zoogloea sp.]